MGDDMIDNGIDKGLSRIKVLAVYSAESIVHEAINRIDPQWANGSGYAQLPEDERYTLSTRILETSVQVLKEWQSVINEHINGHFENPKTYFEEWMCLQQLIDVVLDQEATDRMMDRHGFAGMDPDNYFCLFPEDIRGSIHGDIRKMKGEIWEDWSHVVLDCLVIRTKQIVKELTNIPSD